MGFTLLSLLVGVLIGALCIAAMLVLYRMLATTSGDVTKQARADEQVATSSLIIQQELQQAGFGVSSPVPGTDLVMLNHASFSDGKITGDTVGAYTSAVTGNAILWGYNPSGALKTFDAKAYLCEGVMLNYNAKEEGYDLIWLTPAACTGANQWKTLTWKATLLAVGEKGSSPAFRMAPATCWPYGQTIAVTTLQVSYLQTAPAGSSSAPAVSSTSSAALFNAIPVFSVCMPNFRTGTP